jgi:acetoin utilization deacetylase AcuC-like enzyme
VAVNLAGGTHHAQRSRGAGYCVFNDAAIAARVLQSEAAAARRVLRVAVVDLDVHQGDGTAQILFGDPSVFTLSIHAASNFPFRKQTSCLDVGLPDGTSDETYLAELTCALEELQRQFEPQFLIYLAGADAHEGDRLGRLKLSAAGMRARDRLVFAFAERLELPVAVAMAGGYGHDMRTTVDVHFATVECACESWLRRTARNPRVASSPESFETPSV